MHRIVTVSRIKATPDSKCSLGFDRILELDFERTLVMDYNDNYKRKRNSSASSIFSKIACSSTTLANSVTNFFTNLKNTDDPSHGPRSASSHPFDDFDMDTPPLTAHSSQNSWGSHEFDSNRELFARMTSPNYEDKGKSIQRVSETRAFSSSNLPNCHCACSGGTTVATPVQIRSFQTSQMIP